jgi:hypothetical protein
MNLEQALNALPPDAPEKVVEAIFSRPFLNALGFGDLETIPGFKVSNLIVDHAARKNTNDDNIFLHTGQLCLCRTLWRKSARILVCGSS